MNKDVVYICNGINAVVDQKKKKKNIDILLEKTHTLKINT